MGDSQLSRNVTGSDAVVCQFDDPLTDDVWERSAVDENAAQLVDTAVTCPRRMVHYVVH